MSFIDKLKALIGKKTDKVVEESKVCIEVTPSPVVEAMVEETPVVTMEEVSPEVEVVIEQVNTDLGNISTQTNTENQ